MLMLFTKMRKNKRGFTLTELIVVVAILGVLAAVATPMVSNYIATARTNADLSTAAALRNAVGMAIAEGGTTGLTVSSAGTIDVNTTQTRAVIRAAITTRISGGVMPAPSNTANHYYLTLAGGNVTVAASGTASSAATINLNLTD